ncbi:LysR family transcriptional regulator [Paenibacillus doosanensis]|uniref:HTH-type transcriptional regulator GltC n=1 Tax=Paenibacillus konkukensis TaxID=2020716 RepID=A0ABY4RGX7_9BACL|nr:MULTISPECIES: LysR family transcriptional regulator [Paenibacillus]MCS7462304.1 LysR family transcriptional regulator [Paenibacillus doosanensis]UQZ80884.1 HTH-type transcriptional regulator GltC [Paenibacillus konkukensis]
MEWQQIEYFQVVAQMQHFTRAAERLAVSQSTLSRSIAKLEEELGVPLFERVGRGVTLNPYGELFYKRTSRVLQDLEEAKQEIWDLLKPDYGTLSFAFLKSLGGFEVPQLVSRFLAEHPHVQFQLYQKSSSEMMEQLLSGEIDYCLSSMTEERPDIEWEYLWSEELYVYVARSHPLALRESIALHEIAGERIVALKKGYGTRTIFEELFREAGLPPNITFEGEDPVTVIGFVAAGLGVALLPQLKRVDTSEVVLLQVKEPACRRSIGIAWNARKYLSPVAKQFYGFLVGYYREGGGAGLGRKETF